MTTFAHAYSDATDWTQLAMSHCKLFLNLTGGLAAAALGRVVCLLAK